MLRHVAHDLRSPLISLRSLADALRADPRLGIDDTAIARIDRCARRALELSEQFILFGRAEDSSTERFGETNLLDILHHVADDLWEDGGRIPHRIQRHANVSGAWTRGDTRLLHRALLNLGWNALRHGPTNAPIHVFLDVDEAGNLRLGVADHGVGFSLDASMMARSDAAHAPGFGLGLALVRRVAEKHGIFLLAAMEENGFAIWLDFRADQVEVVR
jgi:signal transduction histidine kinase